MRTLQLVVALWFSALTCAAAAAADTDEYNNIHTIAIISRVGAKFNFNEYGGTNSNKSIQVPDWGIDEKITSLVTDALSSRFTVIPAGLSGFSDAADLTPLIRNLPPEKNLTPMLSLGKRCAQHWAIYPYLDCEFTAKARFSVVTVIGFTPTI